MVAISNLFTISATLAAAAFCVSAQKITAPGRSPKELAEVMDCQAHCIERPPIFGNKPDPKHTVTDFMKMRDPYDKMPFLVKNMQEIAKPCYANVTGMHTYTQLDSPTFEWYVNCNGQTLARNENQYKGDYDYKKNGFTDKEWKEFNDFTLKGFRRALHNCRGDCRRIHFPKTSSPPTPSATPNAKPNKSTPTVKPTGKPTATPAPKPKTPKSKAEVAPKKPAAKPTKVTKKPAKPTKAAKKPTKPTKKPAPKPTKVTKKPAPKPTKVVKKPTPKPTATQKALPKA
ncbi:hypothetical protein B0O80DRAFT_527470 [Mortierella sp. GBAus27b]|nr:hypothetical protein BGX31_004768 [Mortierella sp. GBA43]KAI8357709.1 hypothetical protein B0O80DRAFT_527470 [Mortierella sp. GBAus27b]